MTTLNAIVIRISITSIVLTGGAINICHPSQTNELVLLEWVN